MQSIQNRALGSLVGSFIGDALGAQTEFKAAKVVQKEYPEGIWEMDCCSRFVGRPGEITDDSEMAIMMLVSMLDRGFYSAEVARQAYTVWKDSGPLDIGITIFGALEGTYNPHSQANGALMRITPLGIYGSKLSVSSLIRISDADCAITHTHQVCKDCNRLFAFALSLAIGKGWTAQEVYDYLCKTASSLSTEPSVLEALHDAKTKRPEGIDGPNRGWVLIAFQLAFYTLLHAPSFEQGMVDVIMQAGDADTNATIYGALAGAFASVEQLPKRWIDALRLSDCAKRLINAPNISLQALARTWVEGLLALPVQQVLY